MDTKKRITLLALCLASSPAWSSNFGLNFSAGIPLLTTDLGSGYTPGLGAKTFTEIEVTRNLGDLPLTWGVYFQGFFISDFGQLPYSSSGISISYFPFGLSLDSVNQSLKSGAQTQKRRIAAFFNAKLGLASLNLREKTGAQTNIGASGLSYSVAAGVEFPISNSLAIGPQMQFLTTILLKDYSDNAISLSGYNFGAQFRYLLD